MARASARLGLGFVLALVAVAGGCEAIVGTALPPYSCVGTDPNACPAGEICSNGACVPCTGPTCTAADAGFPDSADGASDSASDAVGTADSSDTSPAPVDAPVEAPFDAPGDTATEASGPDASCATTGCTCAVSTDCASGLCGVANVLGSTFHAAHGSVCTTTCCTASECPAGFVCYGPGNAGGYCVLSTDLSRPAALGASAPGATCVGDGDCRSGKCQMGHCIDLCCSDGDCTNGTACSLDTAGLDGHQGFACLAHQGAAAHAACTSSAACADNNCQFSTCRPHCCGAMSCAANSFNACVLDTLGSDSTYDCDYPTSSPSGAGFGAACTKATDCASRQCDVANGTCTQACCLDPDCVPYGAFVCRPAGIAPYNLICVKS